MLWGPGLANRMRLDLMGDLAANATRPERANPYMLSHTTSFNHHLGRMPLDLRLLSSQHNVVYYFD